MEEATRQQIKTEDGHPLSSPHQRMRLSSSPSPSAPAAAGGGGGNLEGGVHPPSPARVRCVSTIPSVSSAESFTKVPLLVKASHHPRPTTTPVKAKSFKDHQNFYWILGAGFILCFNAGYVNVLTLSTMHGAPSAHVSGHVSKVSIALTTRDWPMLLTCGLTYLFFLAGATISGVLIHHQTFYLGRNYGRAFLLIAMVLALAVLLENLWDDCVYFVWACALACGCQNALTSKYSGNVIRTTHLTGATTDLGIAMGHMLKGRRDEGWRALIHLNSTVGFLLGGCCGRLMWEALEHWALLVNIGLVTFCGMVHTCYVAYHENLSFLEVLEASGDIKMHRHRVVEGSNSSHCGCSLSRSRSGCRDPPHSLPPDPPTSQLASLVPQGIESEGPSSLVTSPSTAEVGAGEIMMMPLAEVYSTIPTAGERAKTCVLVLHDPDLDDIELPPEEEDDDDEEDFDGSQGSGQSTCSSEEMMETEVEEGSSGGHLRRQETSFVALVLDD